MERDEVLRRLRELAQELGKETLTLKDINESPLSMYWVRKYFENLASALEAAGLQPTKLAKSMATTDDELLDYLADLQGRLGRRPTIADIDRDGRFSQRVFYARFGSPGEALSRLKERKAPGEAPPPLEEQQTPSEESPEMPLPPLQKPDFVALCEDYEVSFREQLLQKLQRLSPRGFEQFARKLLRAYGFEDVSVTQLSQDGGIDGYGRLRLGLATMNVAFQCKRWQGNVGRPEVDKFRGAIQGQFEQGVFFATSDFTSQAQDASLRKGAVPIILLNGTSIVDLVIEKELGIERIPLYIYRDRLEDLIEDDEE